VSKKARGFVKSDKIMILIDNGNNHKFLWQTDGGY